MSGSDRDRLDGRRALVTGGSKGSGKAVVERLREMGADVWATARTMPERYKRPDRFIEADTSTIEGAKTVAMRIAEGGALDILVHVVGGSSTPPGGFAVITEEQWLTEIEPNQVWRHPHHRRHRYAGEEGRHRKHETRQRSSDANVE